jgi:plasmid stabilization system protein ParE
LAYQVDISDAALLDAEEYVQFLRREKGAAAAAERWFRGLVSAIYSLEEMPLRCPTIPEAGEFPSPLRHLIYHSHRIIFRLDRASKTVSIVRIYHGSRKRLRRADIAED